MSPGITRWLSFVAVAGASIGLTGCGLIGYFVGSSIDRSNQGPNRIPDEEVCDIEPSTPVVLVKTDSTRIEDEFVGMDHVPPETVAVWYGQLSSGLLSDSTLPFPGQSIGLDIIPQYGGMQCKGVFLGFDPWNIYWRESASGAHVTTPFDHIVWLRYEPGRRFAGKSLPGLVCEHDVPNMGAIKLKSGNPIPLKDVSQVQATVTTNWEETLIVVGVIIDVAVVMTAAIAYGTLAGAHYGLQ